MRKSGGAKDSELDEQIRIMQSNSAYLKIKASKDGYLLTQYIEASQKIKHGSDFLNSTNRSQNRYFELYHLGSGEKIGSDILDKDLYTPINFQNLDSIYFYSNEYEGQEGLFLHLGRINIKGR